MRRVVFSPYAVLQSAHLRLIGRSSSAMTEEEIVLWGTSAVIAYVVTMTEAMGCMTTVSLPLRRLNRRGAPLSGFMPGG